MAIRATRCVADDNHPVVQHSEADHPLLTMVPTEVLGFEVWPFKDELRVLKVE